MECPPAINSEKHIDILVNELFPPYDPQDIFMQDGASFHTSCVTMDFLNSSNIMLLSDWPAQSPEINIIENLWAILKKNVAKRNPVTKIDLWKFIKEEWFKIPNETIETLYESIPRRLQAVRLAKGFQTKY